MDSTKYELDPIGWGSGSRPSYTLKFFKTVKSGMGSTQSCENNWEAAWYERTEIIIIIIIIIIITFIITVII